MNDAPTSTLAPTVPGTPFAGGFYYGRIRAGDQVFALIRAPKAVGQHPAARWNSKSAAVPAAQSFTDGQANTRAMAEAGSEIAKWALAQSINGFADWHIPALDELEPAYRALKPTESRNYCWARSGINLHAEPQTEPYTPDLPAQTAIEEFRAGGAEAFDPEAYWTSTQYAANSVYAWAQGFDDGGQDGFHKYYVFPVFLVRRELIR